MRCKLFQFGKENQWKNNGVGRARVEKIEDKIFSVFSREDGAEQSWPITTQSAYKRDEPSVISFVCSNTSSEYAMSFKHENAAEYFWKQVQMVLGELNKTPEQRVQIPTMWNLKEVILQVQKLGLPFIMLMKSKNHFFGLLQAFENAERILAKFDGENTEENVAAYHAIQEMLKIVFGLCKHFNNQNLQLESYFLIQF